ncbi:MULTISPECIES: ATP-dependent DNA helicase DinG [unclassified Halorhodospira]|uniref:ATP-dependent DNA helicase DinG n=1 Tax=unclassified Halorhodospira TaxID=2626748 RepID=UPI001EE7C415|nr:MULTISPECIES: ATP-dependent DNA helicase DinG [unclassified Halorhodospira]MCG5540428.1 ATP-dependent DNA helicase DinG [Halorhodospira sp. M39old]MCG5545719.1 ATP-dependent DNA helicase DinG [Halorhodospira sp. M38]
MPDSDITDAIATAYRRVRDEMPGFRERAAQKRMIWEVAKALAGEQDHRLLAIEAPTGTGKSLSYLLGGVPAARSRGLPLVIATATVGLQEQILHQDLPKLARYAGIEVDATVAKGRGRYLCPRNLDELVGQSAIAEAGAQQALAADILGSARWPRPPQAGEPEQLESMAEALTEGRWGGDLDEWADGVADDLRPMVTSTSHSCSGRRCAHFEGCPVYAARDRVSRAEVVITNHDLLLADLQLGEEEGGVLLPAPEQALYVIDEGHHLAAKAVQRFAASARVQAARTWLEEGEGVATDTAAVLPDDAVGEPPDAEAQRLQERLGEVATALQEADTFLQHNYRADAEGERWRFRAGHAPEPVRELAGRVAGPARGLHDALQGFSDRVYAALEAQRGDTQELERQLPRLGFLRERAANLATTWELLAEQDNAGTPPVARWVERQAESDGAVDHRVSVSPVSVAGELARRLWDRCAGAVITSATLTALGRFDHLRSDLGLPDGEAIRQGCLPSPFDYSRSLLHVPALRSDPRDAEAHLAEVCQWLPELLDPYEAALVLFTSRQRMERVAQALPEGLRERLQCQGERSREAMLQRHREAVDAGQGSILFGLAGMAEGVDLPGRYCDHVVIERIPFGVPTEPVTATLSEWLEDQQHSSFHTLSLPRASLRLTQACGRLVRSEDDRGRITILDRRVVTQRYGRQLLDALPPFRRRLD